MSETTPVEYRKAMRYQYSKQGEDVGVVGILDELEQAYADVARLEKEVHEWKDAANVHLDQFHRQFGLREQAEAQSKTRGTELGEARAALKKIAHDENVSHLACPGPPNCDHSHYLTCPVQIARDALEKHED